MNIRKFWLIVLVLVVVVAAGWSSTATAQVRIGIGIGIPGPYYYHPYPHYYSYYPYRVYVAPPPVYVAPSPAPVYVAPPPVYVQPAPAPQAVYQVPGNPPQPTYQQPYYQPAGPQPLTSQYAPRAPGVAVWVAAHPPVYAPTGRLSRSAPGDFVLELFGRQVRQCPTATRANRDGGLGLLGRGIDHRQPRPLSAVGNDACQWPSTGAAGVDLLGRDHGSVPRVLSGLN